MQNSDSNSITLNVGVSTTDYLYVSGGTAFVGLTTTKYPDKVAKSYYEVLEVTDVDNFKCNVGISTIDHTYVEGGLVTDLTPAILKLSASQFYEQLPVTVPPFTSIVGNALRGSQVLPNLEHLMTLKLLTTGVTCSRCLMQQPFSSNLHERNGRILL